MEFDDFSLGCSFMATLTKGLPFSFSSSIIIVSSAPSPHLQTQNPDTGWTEVPLHQDSSTTNSKSEAKGKSAL